MSHSAKSAGARVISSRGCSGRRKDSYGTMSRLKLSRFLISVLAVAAVLALYRLVLLVNNTTVALSLLLVVLGVSARWGLAEATVASIVAVLGLNYFFLEPL